METTFRKPYRTDGMYDFDGAQVRRPITACCLAVFDDDLRLVWNRSTLIYEVHRMQPFVRRFYVDGLGDLSYIDHVSVFVCEWRNGLEGRDDPYYLIRHLHERDTQRNPHLSRDLDYQLVCDRIKRQEKIHENYQYALRSNRRLLERAIDKTFNGFPANNMARRRSWSC